MQDMKLLQDQIDGLKGKREELRRDQTAFIKAQGLDEEVEKLRNEAIRYTKDAEAVKGRIKELVGRKNKAIQTTADKFAATMGAVLPEGKAAFTVSDDGEAFLGWQRADGVMIPYAGLSGGEKVFFDAALAFALQGNVIIQESAELDGKHLMESLEKYSGGEVQVIVSSCHEPNGLPKGWKEIRL